MFKSVSLVALFTFSLAAQAQELKFSSQEYPPFNYSEGGRDQGFMIELALKVCEKAKIKCSTEVVPLKRALSGVESGERDGVLSLLQNAERDAFATFSIGIVDSPMIYIANTSTKALSALSELKGATVGVVAASTSAKIALSHLKEVGDIKIEEDQNNETLVKKLDAGRFGAKGYVLINRAVYGYLKKKVSSANTHEVYKIKDDSFGIYFSKKSGNQEAIKKFNDELAKFKSSDEFKSLLMKYDF